MDVAAAVLELYGLPPEDFTAARNDLAKAARAAGDVAASAQVKALRKPTLAAWLANQLVRSVPDRIDELTELGAELRDAHLSRDGARLRELTPRRRDLVADLVRTARALGQEHGRRLTDEVAVRLTETLDAALVDPGAAQMLRTGRLTSALRHVGFGLVDEAGEPAHVAPIKAAAPRPAKRVAAPAGRSKAQERADAQRRQELQKRLDEMEADYQAAEADRTAAEAELDAHEHHLSDLDAIIERLTEELEHARAELKRVRSNTHRLERALTRATRAAAAAAKRRDAARGRLETFAS